MVGTSIEDAIIQAVRQTSLESRVVELAQDAVEAVALTGRLARTQEHERMVRMALDDSLSRMVAKIISIRAELREVTRA
jgi:hypothetical protein